MRGTVHRRLGRGNGQMFMKVLKDCCSEKISYVLQSGVMFDVHLLWLRFINLKPYYLHTNHAIRTHWRCQSLCTSSSYEKVENS